MSLISHQSNLKLAALIGVIWLTATPLIAQQPAGRGGNPFGGKWSLTIDMTTAPGGATLAIPYATISPYHCTYHAEKREFQVKEDGTFEWAENDAGSTSHDGKSEHFSFTGDRRLNLRASGNVQARTAGEAREEDRRLTLKLEVIGGNGRATGTGGGRTNTGIFIVSADWSQFTNYPGGTTVPNPVWAIDWTDLKPSSVKDEDLGSEVIRRTTRYQAARPSRIPSEVNGLFTPPVMERIEVKQVRYLNVVPRG
jgi:hypothetical protein